MEISPRLATIGSNEHGILLIYLEQAGVSNPVRGGCFMCDTAVSCPKPQSFGTGSLMSAYLVFGIVTVSLAVTILFLGHNVTVRMGDKTISYFTFAPKVSDVLREVGIKGNIGPVDPALLAEGESAEYFTVSQELAARVSEGMNIRVYQNRIARTVEHRVVPMPVRREWDIFLEPGQERVISSGSDGIRKDNYLVQSRDGQIVSKTLTGTKVIKSPQARVIACGSYETVSRQAAVHGGRPVKFVSTAYTFTGHHTAVGAKTRRGIIAVDPRVIPMGTRLYIEGYGYGVAADTGGAIKGRKIDVFFESRREALKWGRRTVNVYIL
ncbi:MAG: hypothetical protein CVU89_09470 [Firmicutes bacterium HGW-Firmicutes-14]|nr:MAG: hypothetical protein CVU89_09470 [Firmicutes bacterium HGW-Firmicutes-14]